MNLKVSRMDVWTAEIDDKPGGLARTLRAIADRGFDLDCVIGRRQPDTSGKGVLFVSPVKSGEQLDQVGFRRAPQMPTLKIEGTSEPGAGAMLTKMIADAGVNMNSLSAAVLGHRFVCYAGFDSIQDLEKAETALKPLTIPHWQFWHRRTEPRAA